MRAARYVARGQIELLDAPPVSPTAGPVLVRIQSLAICGSDLHLVYDSPEADYPFAPGYSGHECAGVVEASTVAEFKPGDRVLVIPPRADALVDYIALEPQWLIPIPDALALQPGVLAQLLGCVIFCCKKLGNVLDKTAVVVGQGPAGILFTRLLSQLGAKCVIGLDLLDDRLAVARRMGADHTLNVQQVDPVEAVRALTHGALADIVIEAAGQEQSINLCADLLHPFGELAFFGGPKRSVVAFEYEKFLRKQLRTTTSAHTQQEPGLRSFRLAMDLIAAGKIDVAPLISHRLPFPQVNQAFDLAHAKRDGALKVFLDLTQ